MPMATRTCPRLERRTVVLEYVSWGIGFVLVVGLLVYVWNELKDKRPRHSPEERYHEALEAWLAGDLDGAAELLNQLIQDHPESIDPYLQLGTLLRIKGDPERAAVLHRSLTVRQDLGRPRKVAAGLALAEDLLELEQWDGAREVLDDLIRDASELPRYWRARFRHWHGSGHLPDAARALKRAHRSVADADKEEFRRSYVAYQLDRALEAVRRNESGEARARLKDVKGFDRARTRVSLVKAMLAAAGNDPTKALTIASEDLLDHPEALGILMPKLQQVLLESGQFPRTLPVLERACQAENAPPSMWIELAQLYEKIGDRGKALRLIESKAGDGDLTPDKAAPYLRLLADAIDTTDFGRVWACLDMPRQGTAWFCSQCGHRTAHVRWFCENCHSFDTFQLQLDEKGSP